MHSANPSIAVYGATGHTGQFVVHEAQRRGLPVVAVGRSAATRRMTDDDDNVDTPRVRGK